MRTRQQFVPAFILASILCLLTQTTFLKAQVEVYSADPSVTEQGTINLNVTITGKGFKKGATSKFLVTGTEDPGGIKVNSTTFVSATTLISNIDVAPDAQTTSKFDIAVTSGGRTGKGIEKFAVAAKGQPVSNGVPLDATIDGEESTCSVGICSNGEGDYIQGVGGVGGGIMYTGELHYNGLEVYVDFGSPISLEVGESEPPNRLWFANIFSSPEMTGLKPVEYCGDNAILSGPLYDLVEGECQYIQMGVGLYEAGESGARYRVLFHRAEAESDDNTSLVVVTCLNNGGNGKCSEWRLEPVPVDVVVGELSQGIHYSAKVISQYFPDSGPKRNKIVRVPVGYFDMPFGMTLRAHQP